MLKKLVCSLGVAAAAVSAGVFWLEKPTQAQNRLAANFEPRQGEDPKPTAKLPVTQVVMFNSGVGYFQRSGTVNGDARVELLFPASGINDMIKTLVVTDAKGKSSPLRYDSQEPIEKTLKSFGVDLSSNPSYGQIINQIRGEKVEVTMAAAAVNLPATLQGTIMGMESSVHAEDGKTPVEKEYLNLLSAEGLRNIPLKDIQRVRFLNGVIESELKRALEVVASGHDSQKKTVRLGFKGEGQREVKVSYVAEHPIWKTSYRIRIDAKGKAQLEGWASVDNTSDEDWNDVKLVLVSSRPISYQMDMYAPLNIPRPVVEPELFASLRPPTYGGPMAPGGGQFGGPVANSGSANAVTLGQDKGFGNPNDNQFGGRGGGGRPGSQPSANPNGYPNQSQLNLGNTTANGTLNLTGNGLVLNGASTLTLNKYQTFGNNEQALNQGKLSYEEFQNRRNADNTKKPSQQQVKEAAEVGSIVADVDPKLIEAALASSELGNPTRFAIEEKIKLPRQQSAMIPLFDLPLESEQVSIYNPRVQAKHPLNGLRIKNPTKQSLMQGPITVLSDEQYVGESRISDLQPGEQRFLSYAVDVGVEIKPYDTVTPSPSMTVSILNNQLNVGYRLRSTRTYAIKNNTPEDRVIVIEQGLRAGWRLVDEKSALETTRDMYRFKVPVKSGQLVKYDVKEELPRIDPYTVTKQANWNGFATSMGLDVWTSNDRAPEEKFTVRAGADNMLVVTHKDRRLFTYNLVNRSETERTIDIEHFLSADRRLVGDLKPDPQNKLKFTHRLTLPAAKKDEEPKPVSFTVVEESKDLIHESFPLAGGPVGRNSKPLTPAAPSGVEELPPARFITPLELEVWQRDEPMPEVLTQGRFVKGVLASTVTVRVKHVYTLRNTSDKARTIVIEQIVPPGSSLAGVAQVAGQGGLRKEFAVEVPAGKIVAQEVTIETKVKRSSTFEELQATNEETLKNIRTSDSLSRPVQQAVEKGLGMLAGLKSLETQLKEQNDLLKRTADDQKRIRDAFEKLPETAPLYKRYLDKLDALENDFEKTQTKIRELEAAQKKQKAEYEAFVKDLNAE